MTMTDLTLWAQTNPYPEGDGRRPSVADVCVRCDLPLGTDYAFGDPHTDRWIHHACSTPADR